MKTAYLSNKGKYTFFTFRDTTIKFLTSKNLEKYTSIVEWDKGYLVVMSKNYNQEECEDYIDLVPILRNLYMVLFVTLRVATFLKKFNPTLCPNRQISHCY